MCHHGEVHAIASRSVDQAQAVADELGIAVAHGSYEALLDDPTIDAVYIPLPNHLHAEWTIKAAEAGKHVLCEKPIALDAAEARQMVEVCERAGVKLMEAFMYRLHPAWLAARQMIASGNIGELQSVQTWFGYHNADPTNIRNVAASGGGALYDIGCYAVSGSRFLFDDEPIRAQGMFRRETPDGVDVIAAGLLEFPGGIATFATSTRTETDQQVVAHGSDGLLSISIPFNIPLDRPVEVRFTQGGNPPVAPHTEVTTIAAANMYTLEIDAFSRAVIDDTDVPIAPSDAVANMVVLDALRASAGSSNRV